MFISFAYRDFKTTLQIYEPDYSIIERQASQPQLGKKSPINCAL